MYKKDAERKLQNMSSCTASEFNQATNTYLVLEDGSVFFGKSFGADVSIDGEIGEFVNRIEHMFLSRVR